MERKPLPCSFTWFAVSFAQCHFCRILNISEHTIFAAAIYESAAYHVTLHFIIFVFWKFQIDYPLPIWICSALSWLSRNFWRTMSAQKRTISGEFELKIIENLIIFRVFEMTLKWPFRAFEMTWTLGSTAFLQQNCVEHEFVFFLQNYSLQKPW